MLKQSFKNKIFNEIDFSLKLVMPTMSATIGADMYDKLRNKCPNQVNAEKSDIANKLDKWGHADVVIYSPTIEAGVSFDSFHFYRLYVITCNSWS